MCLAGASACIRIGENPWFFTYSKASCCSKIPETFKSSYRPAKSPFAGRLRNATCSPSRMTNTVRSSILRAFALVFTGIVSILSCRRASQNPYHGHSGQCGAPFGTHTIAPNSISAWLNLRGIRPFVTSVSIIACRLRSIALRTDCFMISESSAHTREITRSTFPSTAGTGRL